MSSSRCKDGKIAVANTGCIRPTCVVGALNEAGDDGIVEQLSQRLGVDEIKILAGQLPALFLWQKMQGEDEVVCRNAAWALTHKTDAEVATLPQQPLIDFAMSTPWDSLRRLALQLISRQPMPQEAVRTDFLDFCLTHMVMLEEPVGVQSLCMKIAHHICSFYPELQHEFVETLRLMHPEAYKPGVTYLIKKYLALYQ